ncbi:VAMP-associated protein [Fomitiporia mediterranea MF3/22]|uniref:VAMP-associated protein n=1 Tax=Fomitiporia mediterranea (strain MF3/22) TaxID=694068 RepID=UPI00044084AC|nr:VAMP-associated protein [Fomitiporia mediterranea MF3/22]EJC97811.1 VAMP-associated protein [Fomitiporia mediterranea MF3/22]
MSVFLEPSSSLGFNRPLTQLVKRVLTVKNPNEQPVAFKVKTTAPKLYCVRPNSGRIEPGQSVQVQVLLQAMKEEPPANAKCKDKFLVQSTIITEEKEAMPLQELWNNIDGQESDVHSQKIKVVYLPPVGQELPEEDEGPGSFVDHSSRYDTVRQEPEAANGRPEVGLPIEPQVPLERAFSPAVGDYAVPEDTEHVEEHPATSRIPPAIAPAPVIQPSMSSEDELRAQLTAAQAEINRLRNLLESIPEPGADDNGLRQRRVRSEKSDDMTVLSDRSASETDLGTMVDSSNASQEGISPQVVGIIAFVVFILTYMFF